MYQHFTIEEAEEITRAKLDESQLSSQVCGFTDDSIVDDTARHGTGDLLYHHLVSSGVSIRVIECSFSILLLGGMQRENCLAHARLCEQYPQQVSIGVDVKYGHESGYLYTLTVQYL